DGLDAAADLAEPHAAGPRPGQDDVDHAAAVLGDVLLLPCRPGAVLADEQHPVDCPAVDDQQATGRAGLIRSAPGSFASQEATCAATPGGFFNGGTKFAEGCDQRRSVNRRTDAAGSPRRSGRWR